jgi:hypothetical protein
LREMSSCAWCARLMTTRWPRFQSSRLLSIGTDYVLHSARRRLPTASRRGLPSSEQPRAGVVGSTRPRSTRWLGREALRGQRRMRLEEAMSSLCNAIIASADLMDSYEWRHMVCDRKILTPLGVKLDPAAVRGLARQSSVFHVSVKYPIYSAVRTFSVSAYFVKFGADKVDVPRRVAG